MNIQPKEVYKSRDYMLVYDNEQAIQDLQIHEPTFDKIMSRYWGVIVTSKGKDVDFVLVFSPTSHYLGKSRYRISTL